MKHRHFSLQPFPAASAPPLKLTGALAREVDKLALTWELRGGLAQVAIPAPSTAPARRPGLWQETCFEFFLGVKGSPQYWEFNLSPTGHWNVYHFAAYRQGMAEETAFASLSMAVQSRPDSLRLALEVDLAKIVRAGQTLEVAISAVVKGRDGRLTYWALTHPGPQADFHRRDSFIVVI